MDFHSLARKELQALCKKNKIPANMTNVAMADALTALENVEGLDELLNPSDSNLSQSPEKNVNGSPDIPRTAGRASTRRKPIRPEPETMQPLTRTRRGTRGSTTQGIDEENKDVNVLITPAPAVPGSRRRAPATSTRRKIDTQLRETEEDEKNEAQERSDAAIAKTPAVPSTRRRALAASARGKLEVENSVQRVYSTRHSVRLLEKTMGKMSLVENEKSGPVKIDDFSEEMDNASEKSELSVQVEKDMSETNTQTVSEMGSEETNDSEVLSDPKPIGSMDIEREFKVDENEEDNLKSKEELGSEMADTSSVVKVSEETNDSEVLSDPKPIGSMDIEREFKVDENEEDNLKSKEELGSEMADTSSVVKVSEAMEEAHDDEGSDESDIISSEKLEMAIDVDAAIVDEKGPDDVPVTEQDTISEDSLAVKVSNGASSEDVDVDHVSESLSPQHGIEESVKESLEPQHECQNQASKDSDLNVTEVDDHDSCDTESDSTTEGESDSEFESSTEGESDEDSSECEENYSDAETEEKDVEAPVLPIGFEKLEDKMDFKEESGSESIAAEQLDIQVSVENQASTMEIYNTEALVDVYVTEAEEVAMKTNDQSLDETPIDSISEAKAQEGIMSETLIDVCVMPAHESNTMKMSPDLVSNGEVAYEIPFQPFAADQLSGQFPRPTQLTPRKSSGIKQSAIPMITDVSDEDEENIENAVKVEPEKDMAKQDENAVDEVSKILAGMSLRQLKKKWKEMSITNNKKSYEDQNADKEQVGKKRIALQALPENRMAVREN